LLNLTAPVRVAVIDVAGPLADIDCGRAGQPPYTAAWILVCKAGRPLGSIEIPLRDPVIAVAELELEVSRQLGQEDGQRDLVAHQPPPLPLSRASVVVPTNFARPAELRRCLKSLAELDHPDYEVIVVDNRPADAPIAELDGVRVVREPRPGISAARNRGVSVATGEIIAFTDDDVQAHPGWLSALGSRFARQPHVSIVTGLVVPLELETQAQVFFEQSGSGLDRGFAPLTFERAGRFRVRRRDQQAASELVRSMYLTGEYGFGANMAFRTAVLQASGGFDQALGVGTPTRGGEDLAMFIQLLTAGHQIGYEPSAIIEHQHRATMDDLDRQIYGYGLGFTAMLTAVALRDPWHLLGLAAIVPAWLKSLRAESSAKSVNRADDYPSDVSRAEFRGMAAGPIAYLRTRLGSPPWRR
jgi:glycosyltransferase involved in cell wall biosynthesis